MVERFLFLANEKSTPKTRNLHPKNEESTPKKLTQKREIHTQNEKSTPTKTRDSHPKREIYTHSKKSTGSKQTLYKKHMPESKKYIK